MAAHTSAHVCLTSRVVAVWSSPALHDEDLLIVYCKYVCVCVCDVESGAVVWWGADEVMAHVSCLRHHLYHVSPANSSFCGCVTGTMAPANQESRSHPHYFEEASYWQTWGRNIFVLTSHWAGLTTLFVCIEERLLWSSDIIIPANEHCLYFFFYSSTPSWTGYHMFIITIITL